eukprot:a177789_6.p1 GENE.a177789_6~~a177789_6.p1  ORF type:complete len:250 (+),score=89.98 a177789_6:83-751(+)
MAADKTQAVLAMLELEGERADSSAASETENLAAMRASSKRVRQIADNSVRVLDELASGAGDSVDEHAQALQAMVLKLVGLVASKYDESASGAGAVSVTQLRQQQELLLHRCGAVSFENAKRRQELARRRETYLRREEKLLERIADQEREMAKTLMVQAEDTRLSSLRRANDAIVRRVQELAQTSDLRVEQTEQELMAAFNARIVDVNIAIDQLAERVRKGRD